ncbi:hypothetical protein A3D03_03965 [Candidatus Gottesmanbacteria bacterium RIFCSPHIGHO2_02_FULL_40_13]|uniref:SecA family profile domain-containing protein n=1 Tax=Candidatus Gottesmanbacteria bacterium RIFCSPHIGHO2_02_FULL_40_13 TaxID=1798384 RepID=A0A1F6A7T3_9BACT|nr:MAG: hypothetical protein A3D03_03965 [Candidatus Gottesmanbacteria bacterium RIFCSPHIGHO2_02_FULL_40_13]
MPIETDASFGLKSLENRERRSELADAILAEKDRLLKIAGLNQNYLNEVQNIGEQYSFSDPQKILNAANELVSAVKAYATIHNPNNSEKYLVGLNAAVVALAEIRILGPETLYKSQRQQQAGEVRRVGIQKEQVEAALAIESMDSAKVPSSQGKSNTAIPIASVVRALFTGEQVHIMVRDPQAKKRDSQNMKLLTESLGMNLGVIERGGNQDEKLLKKQISDLIFIRDIIDYASGISDHRKKKFKEFIAGQIDDSVKKLHFPMIIEDDKSPVEKADSSKPADIIIGDDKDFVFSSMTRDKRFIREKSNASIICDEGDLPWTKGSPYELENRGLSTLSSYLPEWITNSVVDEVCREMQDQGQIILNNHNELEFVDSRGEETHDIYERRLRKRLGEVTKYGNLSPSSLNALISSITTEYSRIIQKLDGIPFPNEFRLKPDNLFKDSAMRKLVRNFAYQDVSAPSAMPEDTSLESQDPIAFYDYAWFTAQKLTPGINYSRSDQEVVLIDPETGHPLPTHQYSGLVDMAVDVKEGVCSFRARSDEVLDRTDFQMFLQTNYGKGHISLVSATLDHIRGEVEEFTGGKVAEIGYWIGREMPVSQIEISGDFEKAKNRLLVLVQEASTSGRPVEIVCDDDEELGILKQIFDEWLKDNPEYQVNMVTSKSSLESEDEIFAHAGQLNTITLTNPRGGRMVDIKTSRETNDAGGLLLVVWGALKNKAVLQQVLARTARTGSPGETRWMVYKHGGKAALENNPIVKRYRKHLDALQTLQDGQMLDYDYSLLESVHERNNQDDRSLRLLTYAYDEMRQALYTDARKSLRQDIGRLVTQGYIEEYIQMRWHEVIDFIADYYISQVSRYRMDTLGDLSVARGTVLSDTYFRKMLDKYANTLLVDSHNYYIRDPKSGKLRPGFLKHKMRLAPDIDTYLQFKEEEEYRSMLQTHHLGFLPPVNLLEPLRAGLYFPQSPNKLYILTRSINLSVGSRAKTSPHTRYSLRVMSFDDEDRFDGDKVITVAEKDIEELLSQVFYTQNIIKQKALFHELREAHLLPA